MIDFKIMPRQSGKTTELIKMFRMNPGLMIVNHSMHTANIMEKTYDIKIKTYFNYLVNGRGIYYNWIYLDDFANQHIISYQDIINMDQQNKNIFIRTSLNKRIPENFMEYLRNNYPEFLI